MIEKKFNNQDVFLDFVDFVKTKTLPWETIKLSELDDRLIYDGGEIAYLSGGNRYPLRECSLRSFKERLCGGDNQLVNMCFRNYNNEDYVTDLVDYIRWALATMKKHSLADGYVKVSIVDDKVNAIMSDSYVEYLDTQYIHHEGFDMVLDATQEFDFDFKGWWDFAISMAQYATKEKPIIIDGNEYQKVIRIRTSDAGYSSIALSVGLNKDGKYIPMMNDINIVHKGSKYAPDFEVKTTFKNRLRGAFNEAEMVLDKSKADVDRLSATTINFPIGATTHLCEKFGIPKADAMNVINNLVDVPTDAWTLYLDLCEIIADDDMSFEKKLRNTGNLARMLAQDWKEYDAPYEWKGRGKE